METCLSNLYYFQPVFHCLLDRQQQPRFSRHRRSSRSIFLWCLCLKWARPHRGFWSDAELWILHYVAVCQSVDARYFSFSSLQILCSVFRGVHHGGIAFPLLHMKQFDGVSGFWYPHLSVPLSCWWNSCLEDALTLLYSFSFKVTFSSWDCCLPWDNRARSKWGMFSAAQQWHRCAAISANQYPFPCK